MTQTTPPGFGDLLGLFGGVNPVTAITKSISQFQRGVSDLLSAVENFNSTMQQLNAVATRVNGLLDTVEGPVKAFVPQVTRTINAADAMVQQLSGPIDKVAPGLAKLAEVLSAPTLASLPNDLSEFMGVLSDLARRLQPLGQMAEAAGGMFGLRPLAAMFGGASAPATKPEPLPAAKKTTPVKNTAPAKKPAAKKTVAGQRLATNGVATILPGSPVPRTSTITSVPTVTDGGMNARAMPWPSTGEKLPLVTMPTG
jgi:hypothetical protein